MWDENDDFWLRKDSRGLGGQYVSLLKYFSHVRRLYTLVPKLTGGLASLCRFFLIFRVFD